MHEAEKVPERGRYSTRHCSAQVPVVPGVSAVNTKQCFVVDPGPRLGPSVVQGRALGSGPSRSEVPLLENT